MFFIVLGISIFALSALATGLALTLLRKYKVMDIPNIRSNHSNPTPRGGGIAVVMVTLLGFLTTAYLLHQDTATILLLCIGTFILALISFYDDLHHVSIKWRLAFQIIAISAGLYFTPMHGLLFHGMIPPLLETFLLGISWLWFINLYNFMDGIDGITGSETVCIGIGIALIAAVTTLPIGFIHYGLIIASAALGFLIWNWHPARIFMGDVGSVSLGYLNGWLLLQLATQGFWVAALIIPAYYLADSSVTLIRRIIQGERFWESHSKHFYQQAVRAGGSHAQVTTIIIAVNILLLILAFISTLDSLYALICLAAATMLCATLLLYWHHKKPVLSEK